MNEQIVDPTLPWIVICDLDGTAAIKHPDRDIHDMSSCGDDLPNVPVINALKALWLRGNDIVFITCRNEDHREQTEKFISKWLTCPSERHRPWQADYEVIPHALFMQTPGDKRPDGEIKREMYETKVKGLANVECVFEDSPEVIQMYRNDLGLFVFDVGFVEYD